MTSEPSDTPTKPVLVKPYRQGHMDSLCGVYAVVNAIKVAAEPSSLHGHQFEHIFDVATRVLHERDVLHDVLKEGMGVRLIRHMLKAVQEDSEELATFNMCFERVFPPQSAPKLPTILKQLRRRLKQGQTAVIIRIKGKKNHWTVVQYVTERTLYLCDSEGMSRIQLCHVSNDPLHLDGRAYRIVANQAYVVEVRCRQDKYLDGG